MAASRRRVKFTLLPIAEHRQAKVWDSSTVMVLQVPLAGAGRSPRRAVSARLRQPGAGSRSWQLKGVLRPLVRLKDAFVELAVNDSNPRSSSAATCCAMGVVMGPVDFSAYGALTSSVLASRKCKPSSDTSA